MEARTRPITSLVDPRIRPHGSAVRRGRRVVESTRALVVRWRDRVVALLGADPPSTPADREAFEDYANEATARLGQILLALSAALAVVLWPTDSVFFRDEPVARHGLLLWRIAYVGLSVSSIAILGYAARSRHAALALGLILVVLSAGTLGWFGSFADPNAPWLHEAIVLPAFTVCALVGWPARALLIVSLVSAFLIAYLAPHPEYLSYPHLGSVGATMFMSMLFNLGVGHLFYRLVRSHFLRGRALERLASTDNLTALFNRKAFLEVADRELDRAARYRRPLTLLALDIDGFKSVNDGHGHEAGDQVLVHLGAVLRGVLRRSDVAARLGGDEFAVLLPESDAEQARDVAERVRRAFATADVDAAPSPIRCTISIGVAVLADDDVDVASLLRRADRALYDAKRSGRDRIATAVASHTVRPQ